MAKTYLQDGRQGQGVVGWGGKPIYMGWVKKSKRRWFSGDVQHGLTYFADV